jgi:hypothetical protein
MSLDPIQDEMHEGRERLGFNGIKLLPMYAGFDPQAEGLIACGVMRRSASSRSSCILARPAGERPDRLRAAAAPRRRCDPRPGREDHPGPLGHPNEGETVAVIRRHADLHADISALFDRPWRFFQSLMLVHEDNVWEKLLFETEYPVTTVSKTVSGLRSLCDVKIDRM